MDKHKKPSFFVTIFYADKDVEIGSYREKGID